MRYRDTLQNGIITLLTVSALFLFSQTQFFRLGAAGSYFQHFADPAGAGGAAAAVSEQLSAPVRTAVTGAYGRYGSVTLTTDSEDFTPVKALLREVLGSAHSPAETERGVFFDALGSASVYCDFLSPLPLSYLAELMGGSTEETLSVRALAAAESAGRIVLLLWDGDGRYYRLSTAAQPSSLESVLESFELGVSSFAFEEADPASSQLAPCSFFPDPLPDLPQLTAANSPEDTDTLLAALAFNPHTNSRYQDSGGAEVIVEGEQVIRITSNGTLTYSGGESALTVESTDALPSLHEAAVGAQTVLEALVSPGDARLYLFSASQSGQETTLTFGYQSGGVPIRFSDGKPAAEVTLTGRSISALSLRRRQYTVSSALSLLLPLRQAAAIAAGKPGAELSIGYTDTGAAALSAAWLAD